MSDVAQAVHCTVMVAIFEELPTAFVYHISQGDPNSATICFRQKYSYMLGCMQDSYLLLVAHKMVHGT